MVGFFDGAILSFFSRRFYYNLAYKADGIGLKLVTSLTLIVILLLSPWKIYAPVEYIIHKIPDAADTLPAVTYQDHKLSIDKPVPYYLKFGDTPDEFGVIIDTNYKMGDVDALTRYMNENHIIALITEDRMATFKDKSGDQLEITSLKSMQSFTITHENWKKFADTISRWGGFIVLSILFVVLFTGVFVGNLIAAFFTGIVVKILSLICRADIEFSGAMRLAAAARIPVTVTTMAPILIGFYGPTGWLAWFLWVVYLLFAVLSTKSYKV